MQIFLPYPDPTKSLRELDKRRLFNQINECKVIAGAINGARAWRNHPVVLMYKGYSEWVLWLAQMADALYRNSPETLIDQLSQAEPARPPFMGFEPLHQSHRRRLFTKSPHLYPQFRIDGTSQLNIYIVDNQIIYYRDGKRVATLPFQRSQHCLQTSRSL